MASEAQRLIGISLTKIAQSRTHRGGVSLHKNLLVATVLQKARYIFMEEAYNMVHYQSPVAVQLQQHHQQQLLQLQQQQQQRISSQEDLVGLTVEEAGIEQPMSSLPEDVQESSSNLQDFLQPGCVKCGSAGQDKENQPPTYQAAGELTYLDLDKTPSVLKERSNSCLKRRRAVTEWETEEAVQSILPKRRCTTEEQQGDDSVFLDDAASLLSDVVSKEIEQSTNATTTTTINAPITSSSPSTTPSSVEPSQTTSSDNAAAAAAASAAAAGSAMEIDRITSLVSIFSFGMGDGKLNRSVSTPDLCSSQAKDSGDSIQQRPFLAMTV